MHKEAIDLPEMELKDLSYPLLLGTVLLFIVVFSRSIFTLDHTEPDSARYLLSTLVQSEAAIVAIVVTLSLVAVQYAASSYSMRVIEVFKKSPLFWILIFLYIASIIQGLRVLKLIEAEENNIYSLETEISAAYYLGILAFCALIPYTWYILELLNPSMIINILSEKLTFDSILSVERFFEPGDRNDPIQPIIDIMLGSLMKHDEGTLVNGLSVLGSKLKSIIKNNIFKSNLDEIKFSMITFYHFKEISNLAASLKDGFAEVQIIRTIGHIGYITAERNFDFAAREAISVLETAGLNSIDQNLTESIKSAIEALREIGDKATEQNLEGASYRASMAFEAIGVKSAEMNLKQDAHMVAVSLKRIGINAVEKKFGDVVYRTVKALKNIGLKIDDLPSVVDALEAVGLKTVEMIPTADKNIVIQLKAAADEVEEALKEIGENAAKQNLKRPAIQATVSLGDILFARCSYEKAIQAYNKAIYIDRKHDPAWYKKGNALMEMGMYEDALKAYEKYNKLYPNISTGWNYKGRALKALGRDAEADAAFAKARELKAQWERSAAFISEKLQEANQEEALQKALTLR